jgi:nitronate monooxygenase
VRRARFRWSGPFPLRIARERGLNGFKGLKPIVYGGREVWPLVEGGKGVSATNHASSGAWAAAGGIGTVSAVNADSYDADGKIIPQVYHGATRKERHEELIRYAIDGGVDAGQARL